jgi:hypothetical protein
VTVPKDKKNKTTKNYEQTVARVHLVDEQREDYIYLLTMKDLHVM